MTEKEILSQLLRHFYINADRLYFSWREDVSLFTQDAKLNRACLEYIEANNIRSI